MSSSSTPDTVSYTDVTDFDTQKYRNPSRDDSRQSESTRRGQTTPIVALVALFAVCAGVSLYATAVVDLTPSGTGNTLADPTLERVYDTTSEGAVVSPTGLSRVGRVAPDGYRVAVVLTTERGRWTNGEQPPAEPAAGSERIDTATRPVAVSTVDGAVLWGHLRVWVWR